MAIHSGYVGAKTCTKGPQPGARGFMSWYLAKYAAIGGQNSGIYNCRPIRGSTRTTSLHGEGRGVDLGLKFTRKEFEVLAELLRTHSKELGIQCIIYNRKIWSGGYESTGWVHYSGVNPHTDHLHVEMAWWSAELSADEYVVLIEKTIGHKVSGGSIGDVKPSGGTKPPASKPSADKPAASGSVVDWLNARKRASSFAARAKLAAQYGIKGYQGTASQNLALLGKLQGGSTPAAKPNAPAAKTVSQMATEVIQGKHGNGHANRQKSLKVSAATYAQVRAEVNRRA